MRLVVVDSIAFHVRANTELTYAKPLQLVGQMAQLLSHAAPPPRAARTKYK
jgi:hypothetical protein